MASDVSTLVAQLKETQAALVRALQDEYFCEDLEPPQLAFGWSEERLREYFETGGDAAPASGVSAKAAVVSGQPGGGREQPAIVENPAEDTPALAPTAKALVGGDGVEAALKYQSIIIPAGIPDLTDGLFPPDDPLLKRLSSQYRPFTKALVCGTRDGGHSFAPVREGWVVGNGAAAHGLDLRLFVTPGKERKLLGALRYSDAACIGRGFRTNIHGRASRCMTTPASPGATARPVPPARRACRPLEAWAAPAGPGLAS